jgi:hypothetical protein
MSFDNSGDEPRYPDEYCYEDEYRDEPPYYHPQPPHRGNNGRYYNSEAAGTISHVVEALADFAKTLEHERTSRSDIERKRKSALQAMRSEKQMILRYLNERFGERGKLYEKYFALISTALEIENAEIVRLALENILSIYQDNPAEGIDSFAQRISDMNAAVRI